VHSTTSERVAEKINEEYDVNVDKFNNYMYNFAYSGGTTRRFEHTDEEGTLIFYENDWEPSKQENMEMIRGFSRTNKMTYV